MNALIKLLNDVDFDDKSSIDDLFIYFNASYFDHYLGSDEYSEEPVICFSDVGDDSEKKSVFLSIEKRFINLYSQLYELSNSRVSLVLDGCISEYVDFDVYSEALSLTLKENPLYNFYFHDIGLYIMPGYDLTHTFYLMKPFVNILPELEGGIEKSELHILPF